MHDEISNAKIDERSLSIDRILPQTWRIQLQFHSWPKQFEIKIENDADEQNRQQNRKLYFDPPLVLLRDNNKVKFLHVDADVVPKRIN